MTRINVVPVKSLTREHLIAEYRELPRVFALAHKASMSDKPWTHKQPKQYCMSTGHVLFFYDKLGYLAERHKILTLEMLSRGYKPSFTGCLYAKSVSADMIVLGIVSDGLIVEIANDFWLALPDSPAIRREPFFLLCDIAEHCFDDSPDEWTGAEDDSVW